MVDDVCALIGVRDRGYDESGNDIAEPTERVVFCRVGSVTRSEFYAAATTGIRPEMVLYLSDVADYQGEDIVRYPADSGTLYNVVRTYRGDGRSAAGPDGIEIVVQRKIGAKL